MVKTIGVAKTKREEDLLVLLAKTELEKLKGQQSLFIEHDDLVVENFVNSIANNHLQIVGSELILGKIYKKMGFLNDGSCIAQNRKAELKKEYHAKYKELISIEKIMALYKGERDFRRFLMQRIGRKGFKGDSPGEPPHIDFFE